VLSVISWVCVTRARVILADDHPAILEGVRSLLSAEFDIAAEVSDGDAAVEAVRCFEPDVAVLDISMPGLSGLEAAARVGAPTRGPAIVFLTVYEGQEFVDAARTLGAGYVLKRQMGTHLLAAVRAAAARHTPISAPSTSPVRP
jgi:DNA-binding NarL/FixJ family response regulator